MALAPKLGRDVAHQLVGDASKRATRDGRHLKDLLSEDARVRAVVDDSALARLFDPVNYLGSTGVFIDRALAAG